MIKLVHLKAPYMENLYFKRSLKHIKKFEKDYNCIWNEVDIHENNFKKVVHKITKILINQIPWVKNALETVKTLRTMLNKCQMTSLT